MATATASTDRPAGGQLCPEIEFLWRCCGSAGKEEVRGQRLVGLADHHGLVPLLYESLLAAAPPECQEDIRRRFLTHARQALWLTSELLRIVQSLESAGIEALPYKGPVLAELLFGNVARRQFSDLDILLRAADVPRAKEIMRELGYALSLELPPREEGAYLASGYEYTFDAPRGRNLVELQWRILPRIYAIDFDMEGLFQRATPVCLGGRQVHSLGAEDVLLVLSVHAAKHMWLQLSWLADIAALVRSLPLNWDFVQKQAQILGIQRIMAVTFLLTEAVSGFQPPEARNFLADAEAARLGGEILTLIRSGAEYDTESLHYFRTMLSLRERWRDRLCFLQRLLFTPSLSEWQTVRLPSKLFPLYRGVRLFRLMGRLSGQSLTGHES